MYGPGALAAPLSGCRVSATGRRASAGEAEVKRCQCFRGALVDGAPSKVGTQQGVENKNRDQFRTNGISNHGSLTLVDIHNV